MRKLYWGGGGVGVRHEFKRRASLTTYDPPEWGWGMQRQKSNNQCGGNAVINERWGKVVVYIVKARVKLKAKTNNEILESLNQLDSLITQKKFLWSYWIKKV